MPSGPIARWSSTDTISVRKGRPLGHGHPIAAFALAAVLQGCDGASTIVDSLADAPTQIVMLHAETVGSLRTIYATGFPPGGREFEFNGYLTGPTAVGAPNPASQPAAGRIPPAIAATKDAYVAAYWGTDDGATYQLTLRSSYNGRSWPWKCATSVAGTNLEAGASGSSRPAVTYFPPRGTWFVAFRDRTNGSIMLAEFRIPGLAPSPIPGGLSPSECSLVDQPRSVGVSSDYAPALGYAGNNLVVMYTTLRPANVPRPPPPQRPSSLELFALTSPDGTTFTPAPGVRILDPAATPPQSIEPVGPPFLNNTLGDLTLTAGFRPSGNRLGNPSTGVFASTNGTDWTTVKVFSTNFGSGYGPSAAGSTSDRIVVIPRFDHQGFFLSFAGSTPQARAAADSHGAGLAKGPGPISTTIHVCPAGQTMIARTASRDVTGFGGVPKAFYASGDLELLCSPPTTRRTGVCPGGTLYASIRKGVAADRYLVECWTRDPQ